MEYFAQAQVKTKSATFVWKKSPKDRFFVMKYHVADISRIQNASKHGDRHLMLVWMYILPTVEHHIRMKKYAFCAYRKKRIKTLLAPTAAIQRYIPSAPKTSTSWFRRFSSFTTFAYFLKNVCYTYMTEKSFHHQF